MSVNKNMKVKFVKVTKNSQKRKRKRVNKWKIRKMKL